MSSILFITGTDTGVGKTLVTASFLYWLRQRAIQALAVKPFCSGSREDVRLLQSIQPGQLSDAEINPFFFRKPVAPLIAARQTNKSIQLTAVLAAIGKTASRCDLLLVEGAGGLLSPLGEGFTAAELIRDLQADVCIVAANKLGTINHTCLTARTVAPFAKKSLTVTLSRTGPKSDASMATNQAILTELLSPLPVWSLPYVGSRASSAPSIERNARRLSPVWAALFASVQN